MKKWLLIMLASFSSVVSAENESLDCKNAMNTFEINQCASMALDSAQAELTKYLEASFVHNVNDPDLVTAIQVAQKDWQSYMSSHCNSVYTQWRDGSIRGVLAISCKTHLT
ncbi:lysozyme inhibitor LprI family protein, partial [Vibrio cholerae]